MVLYHFRAGIVAVFPAFAVLDPVTKTGNLGVDLFFVLSGFILTYNYARAFPPFGWRSYARFLGARLARIYPVHFATIAIVAAGIAVAQARGIGINHPENYRLVDLAKNLLLVHGWSLDYEFTWNEPSWSLSSEWAVYLAFPVVVVLIARLRAALLVAAAVAALALELAVIRLAGYDGGPLVRVSGEFVAGCLLGQLFLRAHAPRRAWSVVAGVTALAIPAVFDAVAEPDFARIKASLRSPFSCTRSRAVRARRPLGRPRRWRSSRVRRATRST